MKLNDFYYTIKFKVNNNNQRDILYAHCGCVVGRGQVEDENFAECKHAAALFYYIKSNKTYSQTDDQLAWKAPSKKKLELYSHGKTFETLYKKTRGLKRSYLVKDETAINKIARLMEKHYNDLHQRGLYKIITASNPLPSIPSPPPLPVLHEAIKEMILKPLPYEVPPEIFKSLEFLETMPEV